MKVQKHIVGDAPQTFEQGREELLRLIHELAFPTVPSHVTHVVIDGRAGLGKTEALIRALLGLISTVTPVIIAQPRYNLLIETRDRIEDYFKAMGQEAPSLIVLEGMDRLCKYEKWSAAALNYGLRSARFCEGCSIEDCWYHQQFDEARGVQIVLVTHHQLELACGKLGPTGIVWVDEAPELIEDIEFSHKDLVAIQRAQFFPAGISDETRRGIEFYYRARRPFVNLLLELIEAFQSSPREKYREYVWGPELLKVLSELTSGQAFEYDPEAGIFPAVAAGNRVSPGLHIRKDFDDLLRPLLRLFNDQEDLKKGVVSLYKEYRGKPGLVIHRPANLLPAKNPYVVLSAGFSKLAPFYEAVHPGHELNVQSVGVGESKHSSTILFKTKAFSKKYSREPRRRRQALRKTLLAILPEIVLWACRNRKTKVSLGILCPKEHKADLESQVFKYVWDLFTSVGISLDVIDYFGNTHGLDKYGGVDVFVKLGQVIPNVSRGKMLDHHFAKLVGSENAGHHSKAFQAFHEEQDCGRARPSSRTSKNPLLSICFGNYKDGRSVDGRGSTWLSTYYRVLAALCLEFVDQCSAPRLEKVHHELSSVGTTAMSGFWDLEIQDLNPGMQRFWSTNIPEIGIAALKQLFLKYLNRNVASRKSFSREQADNHLKEMARKKEFEPRKQTNIEGTGQEVVYLRPAKDMDQLRQIAPGLYADVNGTAIIPSIATQWHMGHGHKPTNQYLDLQEYLLNVGADKGKGLFNYPLLNGEEVHVPYLGQLEKRARSFPELIEATGLQALHDDVEVPFIALLQEMYNEGLPMPEDILSAYSGKYDFLAKKAWAQSRLHRGMVRVFFTFCNNGRVYTLLGLHQNLPRELRYWVVAPPGYKLVLCDYSAMDVRTLAFLSQDRILKQFLDEAGDFYHRLTRIMLPGKALQRDQVKTFVLTQMNGAGANRIAGKLGLPVRDVEDMFGTWHKLFPGAQAWAERIHDEVRNPPHVLRTALGRLFWGPEAGADNKEMASKAERTGLSFMLQGTGADIFKPALLRLRQALLNEIRFLLQIHDAVLLLVPDERVDDTVATCHRVMCEAPAWFDVPLKVRVEVGQNWGNMEEVKPRSGIIEKICGS